MMSSKKPFGLVIPKKAQAFRPKSSGVFGSDSDDDSAPKGKLAKIPQSKPLSAIKTDETVDPSIYEYDSVYDDMKAQKASEIKPKEKKSSRYIDNLLKAADKRKKEYERRVEKKVQVEREKEGDKFKDKEMFVTSAYKKKMQEREEEEERERRENMLNDMMDVTKQKDLSGFYRHFLKQSVGEEKVPVFGDRDIKKETLSGSDNEESPKVARDIPPEISEQYDDKDLSDSDDSSSEKEELGNENSYEKSVREYRKRKAETSSDEENETLKDCQTSAERSDKSPKKTVKEARDSSLKKSHSKEDSVKTKPKKKIHRESSKDLSSDSDGNKSQVSEKKEVKREHKSKKSLKSKSSSRSMQNQSCNSSDSSISDKSDNEESVNTKMAENGAKKDESQCEKEKLPSKKNIFEKRTVGEVFAAAQAKYFQRLAARSS